MTNSAAHSAPRSDSRRRDLALIHLAKKDLVQSGILDEERYRHVVQGILIDLELKSTRDYPSAADLDATGRTRLMQVFRSDFGWKDRPNPHLKRQHRYVGRGQRGDGIYITQEQADYIALLEDQLGWPDSPRRLLGFIERQLGAKSTVEMLGKKNATLVITGLERLTGYKPHPRSKQPV